MEKSTPVFSRRIASHYVSTPRGLLRGAIVSLNDQGVITGISTPEHVDAEHGVEFYSGILIPGTVNAHCHLELSAMCGEIAPGGGFAAFAAAMSRTRRDVPGRAAAIALQDAAMWQQGVAAVGDVCNGPATFDVKRASRIEYLNFLELFGLKAASAQPLAELAAIARRDGLRYGVTPHAVYSLQTDAFASAVAAGGSADEVPLSIHFMESPGESELFAGRGELHDWYASQGLGIDFAQYESPAGRIVAQVPAGRNIMLIHNTFITEQDVDRLAAHFGDRVTFVLCPRSNRYITGAEPPYAMLRRKSVRIALGTDSLASNTSLSLIDELKMFENIPLEELLLWATANGARALGIDARYGGIEVGKAPGLALLTGIDWQTMSLLPDAAIRRIA